MYTQEQLQPLLTAVNAVLANEDNTGCTDDLTVTSSACCEALRRANNALQSMQLTVVMHHHRHGISTAVALHPETVVLTQDDAISVLVEEFEPDRDEYIELAPFPDDAVVLVGVPPTCLQCGSALTSAGFCTDETCAYSDWPQCVPLADLEASSQAFIEAKHGVTKRDRSPCYRVEYDPEFTGGEYAGTGSFAFVSETLVKQHGSVEAAFTAQTGLAACHIVHYSGDERYTADAEQVTA